MCRSPSLSSTLRICIFWFWCVHVSLCVRVSVWQWRVRMWSIKRKWTSVIYCSESVNALPWMLSVALVVERQMNSKSLLVCLDAKINRRACSRCHLVSRGWLLLDYGRAIVEGTKEVYLSAVVSFMSPSCFTTPNQIKNWDTGQNANMHGWVYPTSHTYDPESNAAGACIENGLMVFLEQKIFHFFSSIHPLASTYLDLVAGFPLSWTSFHQLIYTAASSLQSGTWIISDFGKSVSNKTIQRFIYKSHFKFHRAKRILFVNQRKRWCLWVQRHPGCTNTHGNVLWQISIPNLFARNEKQMEISSTPNMSLHLWVMFAFLLCFPSSFCSCLFCFASELCLYPIWCPSSLTLTILKTYCRCIHADNSVIMQYTASIWFTPS